MLQRIAQSLALKLTLVIILVGFVVVAVVAIFAQQATRREFSQFITSQQRANFVEGVTNHYRLNGTWDGLLQALPRPGPPLGPQPKNEPPPTRVPPPKRGATGAETIGAETTGTATKGTAQNAKESEERPKGSNPPPREGLQNPPPNPQRDPPRGAFVLLDANGCVITPIPPYTRGECLTADKIPAGEVVTLDGEVVGTVFTVNRTTELLEVERVYLTAINRALRNAILVATLLALILGLLMARYLTRPLKELTRAIHAMTGGELKQEVAIRSKDELGELAAAFNQMSADVSHANHLRRQMTADIAHDLRNPLGVLSGYIEAMRDGVLKPTEARLETMHEEVFHLEHLVDDLWTLARADAGELQLTLLSTPPLELLERTATAYAEQANAKHIQLDASASLDLPEVKVDPERMAQVLGNLVSNAIRHTPKGGQIRMNALVNGDFVEILVEDNGSGIEADALPLIFERFYRADSARVQNDGESGLGLAIAKMIVEAHGGQIGVESEVGQGTTFRIRLPL